MKNGCANRTQSRARSSYAEVKPGNHKVILNFDPQTVKTTEIIAYIAYALLILVIALLAFKRMRKS